MKGKKFVWMLLSILIVSSFVLAACGGEATPTETTGGEKLAVGIVLPTKDEPRWIQDETPLQRSPAKRGLQRGNSLQPG